MPSPSTPAGRRYMRRFAPAMAAYVLLLFSVVALLKAHPLAPGPLLYGLALLPALPIMGVIWAMGRYLVEETDEYLRMRQVESVLWACGLTLAAATVWGFLEAFAPMPHLPAYYAFIVFCAALGVARCGRALVDRLAERAP